jgi:hypothetical protein
MRTDSTNTMATLDLSIGATKLAFPNCRARK